MDFLTDLIERWIQKYFKPKPEIKYLSGKGKFPKI